jgi:hypothetical protein
MRGILLVAAALGVAALAPAQAVAKEGEYVRCSLVADDMTVDGGGFADEATALCEASRWAGGWYVPVVGTWSASDCGSGRVAGRITFDIDYYGRTVVDFDVATTGGTGTGTATAVDGSGTSGSGPIVVNETLTQAPCPRTILEPTPIDVGPVQGEIGGIERWDTPALHSTFTVTFG